MTKLNFRHSTAADIPAIMPVYEGAKTFMRRTGNMTQWTGGYPSAEVILNDIALGNHYVGTDADGRIAVVMTLILGPDPTYAYIEDGAWPDNEPYGTIHRIASAGLMPDSLGEALRFAFTKTDRIRIDTHADNHPMLNALKRHGFTRCGIIYIADGSPRTAFAKKNT